MANDLVIIGCGGFGREVVGIVDAVNSACAGLATWNLVGFLDDSPAVRDLQLVGRLSLTVLGPVGESSIVSQEPTYFVVGIGSGLIRQSIARRAEAMGMVPATLIHPNATLGRDVRIGAGTIVAANAHVTTNITLGAHTHLDRATHVGHDTSLGDCVTVHPSAVISGNCHIGARSELGTGCTILPGLTIGEDAVVGAAACVVRDVDADTVVKGIPAR